MTKPLKNIQVDAVITWVDGNDKNWQKKINTYSNSKINPMAYLSLLASVCAFFYHLSNNILWGVEIGSISNLFTEKHLKNFNNLTNINLRTVFLKPKYGDASGVRGAALLSRQNLV